MGAQEFAAITARSTYQHTTALGRIMFYGGIIALIVVSLLLRNAAKRVINLVRGIILIVIVLSYIVDVAFRD